MRRTLALALVLLALAGCGDDKTSGAGGGPVSCSDGTRLVVWNDAGDWIRERPADGADVASGPRGAYDAELEACR